MFRLTFQKALFISFGWHIFCFFAVVIIIAPVTLKEERFSKINFIGPILDKDTFGYFNQGEGFDRSRKKGKGKELMQTAKTDVSFAEERLRHATSVPFLSKPYNNSITEIIKEKKDAQIDLPLLTQQTVTSGVGRIESEVAKRSVLYKPPTPVITGTFQAGKAPPKGEKFLIKLRFLISPEGNVIFIEKIKSCGYPDIDLVAIRYMKKWQFVPLDPNKPKRNQEGIMLVELKAQ